MSIIDTENQYRQFHKKFREEDCIFLPILSDTKAHPQKNSISLIYVSFIKDNDEYILPFNHSESANLPIEFYSDLSDCNNRKFTYDKKLLLHLGKFKNVCDVNFLHYMAINEPLDIFEIDTNAHRFFNLRYYNKSDINTIIPILKQLEYCRKISSVLHDTIKKYEQHINFLYNNDVLENLQYIESNGLQTLNGMVYSEYNPYTSTGRPSNRFGGTNFAALNKTDGSRKPYVSRFGAEGMLVEFDYDAYHLRLIGDLIGYEFPEGSAHSHMAKYYGTDYDGSKALSFKYLYGRIPSKVVETNPFFKKVQQFINLNWDVYKKEDFIESDIYNRRIYKRNLSNMNKNKLFNYLIQLTETENNMRMLTDLIFHLKDFDYESKLVLYSYDSFLFDFNMKDGTGFLSVIKNIIEQFGKYPTKVSKGTNYHQMMDITEKLV